MPQKLPNNPTFRQSRGWDHGRVLINLRDHRRVVRWFFPGPWFRVDPGADASRDERIADPDVIDAQPEIASKRARSIIPPGKLPARLVMQAKRIRETPLFDLLQRRALTVAEHDAPLPQSHVMHVAIFRRDVEVAAKQHRLGPIVMLVKKLS